MLLSDLCARLPYGVKIWYKYYPDKITEQFATSIRLVDRKIALSRKFEKEGDWYPIEEANELLIKPYLRPMSSRTEEEDDFIQQCMDIVEDENYHDGFSPSAWSSMADFVNYCNQHHLDYNGLIGKGLALEAPEDMYKNE